MASLKGTMSSILEDPKVKLLVGMRVSEDEILVLKCPDCGEYGQYDDASYFFCRNCEMGYRCLPVGADTTGYGRYITIDKTITVADVLREESE